MRISLIAILAAVTVMMAVPAFADLQNVEVGGSLRIRGNWYTQEATGGPGFMDAGTSSRSVEQRTTISVTADFTNDTSAVIEIDSYDVWGEDTNTPGYGVGVARTGADVSLYQGYLQMREAWGRPLTLTIGRQEVMFGSEWLVGNGDTAAAFTGLSYDGVTATYDYDSGTVTALWLMIADSNAGGMPGAIGGGEDNDVALYGLYGSYTGHENHTIDAYWLFLRDGTLDSLDIHTLGLRGAGNIDAWDYEAEIAFQTGDEPAGMPDVSAWALNLEVGYSFDANYNPRVFLGVAFFEGADGGDMAFNRLFSDWEYSEFLSNGDISNTLIFRGGVGFQPRENIGIDVLLSWFEEDEEAGGTDDDIGVELGLYLTYDYSEDVSFSVGWAHFFADNDTTDGFMVAGSGTAAAGGDDDDADYLFIETGISF